MKIVDRRVFEVMRGRAEEGLALAMAENLRAFSGRSRVYLTESGTVSRIVFEWEYASLAECEQVWAEWRNGPESAAFFVLEEVERAHGAVCAGTVDPGGVV